MMSPVPPLFVTHSAVVSALGRGTAGLWQSLQSGCGGLIPYDFGQAKLDCWIGRAEGIEDEVMEPEFRRFDCRNNRLAQLALHQDGLLDAVESLKGRVDPKRIGLFLGTSTSGILSGEDAFREFCRSGALPGEFRFRETQDLYSLTDYVRGRLGLLGPAYTVSTACSSSAKVFCDAQRFIATGICDAAVVGGVDSLCYTTLFGFNSLELVSHRPCRPFDRGRNGLSIGEAAGFVILEQEPTGAAPIALLGYGESSDAYHISTPRPDGAGAIRAMKDALQRAGLDVSDIDYVNLHGTATPSNDRIEAQAVNRLFGARVPCSSTKGWTGHALGAAGILEAIITCLCIEHQWIPGTLNCDDPEPDLAIDLRQTSGPGELRRAMSNSFGFGGSNCSLIFGQYPC